MHAVGKIFEQYMRSYQLECHAGFRRTAMGADRVLSGDLTHHGAKILLDSGAFTDAGSRYRHLNQDYAVRKHGCWTVHTMSLPDD